MKILPKVKNLICITSHPKGCKENIATSVRYIKKHTNYTKEKKTILIIGASTGYGLATRLVATFGYKAKTIGIIHEKQNKKTKPATAGWYNTAFLEHVAKKNNIYAKSINIDAYSQEAKIKVIEIIKKELSGKIDLLFYSIASSKRYDQKTNKTYKSSLKPVDTIYKCKTLDIYNKKLKTTIIEPATKDEINNTIKVMGGEDWEIWINYLIKENVLNENFKTIAYSYNGSKITNKIYKNGTIGLAKKNLKKIMYNLNKKLTKKCNGRAYISINTATLTQASIAIPTVSLYIPILNKILKKKYIYENSIDQILKLFKLINNKKTLPNIIRLDNFELREDIQYKINLILKKINTKTLNKYLNLEETKIEFYKLFGFANRKINYSLDSNINILIPSIINKTKN
ncbi:MAG TPA: enoyl-ACP reductase FabV [Candidatus Azoamicus sp. OHIO1]